MVFTVKGVLFQRSEKNAIDAEYDRSSLIKNFTDRLNLGELQVGDITKI